MIIQDCYDVIAETIAKYVTETLVTKGVNVEGLCKEYGDLHTKYGADEFTYALIMKGILLTDRFPFTNRPYRNIGFVVHRKMEVVFDLLELPATQQVAYRLAGSMKRKDIRTIFSPEKLEKLVDPTTSPLELGQHYEWAQRARAIIATMRENIEVKKVLENVTPEQVAFAKGLSFDWYYSYSDDNGVWRAGKNAHDRVREWATEQVAKNPSLYYVIETICEQKLFGPGFFINGR